MSKKIITVFGATGAQGGSVISTFLAHKTLSQQFSLRGITRNTSSEKAQALASKGVDLAAADLNNPKSLEGAVKDSYAVFAVTNYWESQSRDIETAQGKAIADACVAAGVKHLVWSSLPNVTKLTNGTLKHVVHFDGKHDVAEYIDSVKGQSSMISTFFMPGFYMSNFKWMIATDPNVNGGAPTVSLPLHEQETQVALLDAEADTGTFVAAIIGYPDPAELDGKSIQAVSEWLTPAQIVAQLSEVIGREIKFNTISPEVYENMIGGDKGKELAENMVLVRDYSYYGKGSEKQQGESDKVLEPLGFKKETFREWVKKAGPWNF